MKVTFRGAARTVTGSMHRVDTADGKTVLLDCGLYQGRRKKAAKINREMPLPVEEIDAVLLSHAHIDHSGLLPRLYKEGYRGPVYATPATADLSGIMLRDSAHIQEADVRYVNKKNEARGLPPVEPLYEIPDAEGVSGLFIPVDCREVFTPVEGLEVEYRDAGHILGSASMTLMAREEEREVRLGFTGDVGRPDRLIIRDPQPMMDCDWLITESTYGGQVHDPPESAKKRLEEVIGRTVERGGKVIIPAFSVGRTQEIVHTLDQLWNEGRLPMIPVYVDSPLAVNATDIYKDHPECYDQDLREYILSDADPFGFRRLTYVRNVEESKALNGRRDPMVIISASGMCEGGRILHHLKNNIHDERNTVLMVGYSAEHTLGRRISERRSRVRIFGTEYALRAQVEVMDAYSAHADQPELLDFLEPLHTARLKGVFLVHGSLDRQEAMRKELRRKGCDNVMVPERGQSFTL
ncbi:MAG: MBL fold metallo-hydrolase [bacterium]